MSTFTTNRASFHIKILYLCVSILTLMLLFEVLVIFKMYKAFLTKMEVTHIKRGGNLKKDTNNSDNNQNVFQSDMEEHTRSKRQSIDGIDYRAIMQVHV